MRNVKVGCKTHSSRNTLDSIRNYMEWIKRYIFLRSKRQVLAGGSQAASHFSTL